MEDAKMEQGAASRLIPSPLSQSGRGDWGARMRVYQKFYEHSTHKILDVITILCIHTCNINMQNVVHTHRYPPT